MNIARQGPTLRISDIPELGAASPLLFDSVLTQLLCANIRQVEFDLTETEFVDCAGVGALLSFRSSAQGENPGIEIRMMSPPASVKRLFTLLGLDRIFPMSAMHEPGELASATAKPETAAPAPVLPSPGTLPLLEIPIGSAVASGWVKNPIV